jgi:hypothetical protein
LQLASDLFAMMTEQFDCVTMGQHADAVAVKQPMIVAPSLG